MILLPGAEGSMFNIHSDSAGLGLLLLLLGHYLTLAWCVLSGVLITWGVARRKRFAGFLDLALSLLAGTLAAYSGDRDRRIQGL
jgi:hypothetical protein